MKADRGFTIIELVMVTVVTGALAVVAMIAIWGAMTSFKIDAAATKVISDLRYAQHLARTYNGWYGVDFSIDPDNHYDVYATDGSTDTAVQNPANRTENLQIDVEDEYGVTISAVNIAGGDKVEFNPLGTPYDDKLGSKLSTAGTITLTHGASTRIVQIIPNTGKAELQ